MGEGGKEGRKVAEAHKRGSTRDSTLITLDRQRPPSEKPEGGGRVVVEM